MPFSTCLCVCVCLVGWREIELDVCMAISVLASITIDITFSLGAHSAAGLDLGDGTIHAMSFMG